jgi:hypothetical protein
MASRRRHQRYLPATPWEGAFRVLRDVLVQTEHGGGLVAISRAPAVMGEALTLNLAGAGRTVSLRVQVIESRPVIVAGGVRHRIRLDILESLQVAQ